MTMALMFIGASPGSTGGGVKTTTFSITVAALWATVRGDPETEIFGRRIPAETVAQGVFHLADCISWPEHGRRSGARHRGPRSAADALRNDLGIRHRRPVDGGERERREPSAFFTTAASC